MYNMVTVKNIARRWGHSLGFIIPSDVAKNIDLKEGQPLEIEIKLKTKINAFGKFKRGRPFNRKENERSGFW